MTGEYRVTAGDPHFEGMYDAIEHSPYRVGDSVVRCSHCGRILKTEYVSDGCPLCHSSPFISVPVFTRSSQHSPIMPPVSAHSSASFRSHGCLLALLFVSVFLVSVIFAMLDEKAIDFLFFHVSYVAALAYISIGSVCLCILGYMHPSLLRCWEHKRLGILIGLLPLSVYVFPLLIHLVILVVSFLLNILAYVLIIGAIIAIVSAFD